MYSRTSYICVFASILLCMSASLTAQKGFKVGEKARGNLTYRKLSQLSPLFDKLGKPKKGEWLYSNEEKGQTYKQYINSRPTLPRGRRQFIYIQPIGKLSKEQQEIVDKTIEFMGIYYGMEVKTKLPLPMNIVLRDAQRKNPKGENKQLLTNYILYKVLTPRMPEDAFIYLALTSADLWPGGDKHYVLGQASPENRIGVWSLYRNGDPSKSKAAYEKCLLRTIKTACHEVGHMLGMTHCTTCKCGMNGSGGQAESDQRPLALCPECLAKICLLENIKPLDRYKKLQAFCEKNGLKEQAEFYGKCIKKLQ